MSEDWEETRLRQLLHTSGDDLLRYFERRVACPEDAADLLAETALVAWRRVRDVPEDASGRLWLFGVASKVLANHRRSRRRYGSLVARLRSELHATPTHQSDGQQGVVVRDAVDRLSDDHREVVKLVHWDGFTLAEAAEILQLNASTARSRYAAAREVLRTMLGSTSAAITPR